MDARQTILSNKAFRGTLDLVTKSAVGPAKWFCSKCSMRDITHLLRGANPFRFHRQISLPVSPQLCRYTGAFACDSFLLYPFIALDSSFLSLPYLLKIAPSVDHQCSVRLTANWQENWIRHESRGISSNSSKDEIMDVHVCAIRTACS